MAQIKVQVCV